MTDHNSPLFDLGRVVATPGAMRALEAAGEVVTHFIARHQRGDWGVVCGEDARANDAALGDGGRIFSAYLLRDGTKIWIITEAVGARSRRASTCVLLPEEY